MKNIIAILSILLVFGCTTDKKAKTSFKTSKESEYTGNFKAIVIDGDNSKSYNVKIRCSNFDKDYFQFFSDKDDVSDSNGDGLIISGFQDGKKLNLTLVDNGKSLSSGNITDFEKIRTLLALKGKGLLFKGKGFKEKGKNTVTVTFSVACE